MIHPGLKVFKNLKSGEEIKVKKEDVPGLGELLTPTEGGLAADNRS